LRYIATTIQLFCTVSYIKFNVGLNDNLKALEVVNQLTPDVMCKIENIVDKKPAAAERFGQ